MFDIKAKYTEKTKAGTITKHLDLINVNYGFLIKTLLIYQAEYLNAIFLDRDQILELSIKPTETNKGA